MSEYDLQGPDVDERGNSHFQDDDTGQEGEEYVVTYNLLEEEKEEKKADHELPKRTKVVKEALSSPELEEQKKAKEAVTIYELTVKDIDGNEVSLAKFKGKVTMIVNIAFKGHEAQLNFSGLSHLQKRYKHRGLEIMGFPCFQFESRELHSIGNEWEGAFTIFEEVNVHGPYISPIYLFLKENGVEIKWNFEKVLIGKDGKIHGNFTAAPDLLKGQVEYLCGRLS